MIALISLSAPGARLARLLAQQWPETELFFHESISPDPDTDQKAVRKVTRFSRIIDLIAAIYAGSQGLVFFGPCGIMVRALAPYVRDKLTDPPVVVVDAGGRYTISLLSGHEGGANDLALQVANALGAEPVITTATEAVKNIVVGVGCRRDCSAAAIMEAVNHALQIAGITLAEVRYMASADIKKNEPGLIQAAAALGLPLRFISSEEIRASQRIFSRSAFVEEKVDLPAVAEPAALLAGRRTALILPKTIWNNVTVALARENFL